MPTNSKKVAVNCKAPNGLILRQHKTIDTGMGMKQSQPTGETVELKPGRNEDVDDAFIRAWLEQNPDQATMIEILEEKKEQKNG